MAIKLKHTWYYNEFQQVGLDFENTDEVKRYDSDIENSRNRREELNYLSDAVELKPEHVLMEIGTATGEFAVEFSKICRKVYALDVSSAMIDYARNKADFQNRDNVEFIHGGILSYEHAGEPIDCIVTQIALHHLPDVWKMVAIKRMYDMLKPGGKLCLRDCMLSVGIEEFDDYIESYIESHRKRVGDVIAQSIFLNIKEEYPTFIWIIEEMLKQAGFCIDKKDIHNGYMASFTCTK